MEKGIIKRLILEKQQEFPFSCTLCQEIGYQGLMSNGVATIQPIKKPKGRDLSEEEKTFNRKASSFRVRVEHAIGSTKLMRIVKDESGA